jgi:hypothetical protein
VELRVAAFAEHGQVFRQLLPAPDVGKVVDVQVLLGGAELAAETGSAQGDHPSEDPVRGLQILFVWHALEFINFSLSPLF